MDLVARFSTGSKGPRDHVNVGSVGLRGPSGPISTKRHSATSGIPEGPSIDVPDAQASKYSYRRHIHAKVCHVGPGPQRYAQSWPHT